MNLVQSHRLRLRYLLLLAPLLVASTPAPLSLARELVLGQIALTGQLAFYNPPAEIVANACMPITVRLNSTLGLPLGALLPLTIKLGANPPEGAFYGSNTCGPLNDTLTIPIGGNQATGWYKTMTATSTGKSVTLTASTGALGVQEPAPLTLPVVPNGTAGFEFSLVPSQVLEGAPFEVTVTAVDAFGARIESYGGTVHLSSNPPVEWLHPDVTFSPENDKGVKKFTLVLPAGGLYTLTVRDVSNDNLMGFSPSITVQAQQPIPRVRVTPPSSPAATCSSTQLSLAVVDSSGTPTSGSAYVSFCKAGPGPAVILDSSFGDVTTDKTCVFGTLTDTGQVQVGNAQPELDVPFMLYSAPSNTPVFVTFRPEPSADKSSLSFVGSDVNVPQLSPSSPPVTLQLHLNDYCGRPMAVPVDKLTFSAEAPLSLGAISSSPGQWTIPVQLSECTTGLSQPLAISPLLGGAPLFGGQLDRHIQPLCGTSAELSVYSLMSDQEVTPGEQVLFAAELSNTGQTAIRDGVLVLSAQGLSTVEASREGVPLVQGQSGFVVPELLPGTKAKVKVSAVATTQLDQPVTATVRYTTSNGTPLTEDEPIRFTRDDLEGVNVGCGCHSAGLPSQLLPWLALLLAASRPWDRLHRLRRGERIDRQAPW